MSGFMDRLTGRKPTPAQSAKDRLKLVLVTDRTTISPEDLRKMQSEILDVIRKYCRINEDAVDMKFEQRDRENYLVADIPLSSGRLDEPIGSVRLETSITTSDDEEDTIGEKPAELSAATNESKTDEVTPASDTKPGESTDALDEDTLKLKPKAFEEEKPEDEKKKEDE